MNKITVIAIFDIGKTNKKLLLFDEKYQLVLEESIKLEETTDEDGFACEDVTVLAQWVNKSFNKILQDNKFVIRGVNVSAYGASFVYLDSQGHVMLPLYNYLKPFPPLLLDKFYDDYGGEKSIGQQTASPSLGNLNSALQLYRLKYEKTDVFNKIKYALHLPQYISYLLSSKIHSDITSIGCHTYLWDFSESDYHTWVHEEKIFGKLAPIKDCSEIAGYSANDIPVGVGLHDSSAALISYLTSFSEPFILLSTGTWCISLNPFNHSALSSDELQNDCLCYLSYDGKPVKASRLFAGYEHEQQIKKLAAYFGTSETYYTSVACDLEVLKTIKPIERNASENDGSAMTAQSSFAQRNLEEFGSYEKAYHQLIADIVAQQVESTELILNDTEVKRIFVDGGFSRNPIYMYLLADAFRDMEVYAASVPQASALGAALVFHQHWNSKPIPSDIIDLKLYAHSKSST